MTPFRGRRLAAALAVLLPLLGGVRLSLHVPGGSALRSPVKGPRKCVAERVEGAAARRRSPEQRPAASEPPQESSVVRPILVAAPRDTDWDRTPRALKLCLARDSHSTLAPPAL